MPYKLLASGSNGAGQLGISHLDDVSTYTTCEFCSQPWNAEASSSQVKQFSPAGRILNIVSGAGHSLLLANDDLTSSQGEKMSVWATGSNEYGQLGSAFQDDGLADQRLVWTRISTMKLLKRAGLSVDPFHRYTPIQVACSWTTSFIAFRCWTRSGQFDWRQASDVILSFGSNDFGELGIDDSNRILQADTVNTLVRVVHLPVSNTQCRNNGETIHIQTLKASQRHIVCIYDEVLTDQESSSSATRRIIAGWGAARHGQLSIESAHSSNRSSPISLQRKAETLTRSSPSSSPSHLKRGSALSRNPGNLPPRGNLKLKKSSYPAAFKNPMQIDVLSAFRDAGKSIPQIASVSVGAGHTVILLHHPIEGDTYEIIGLGNNLKGQIELSEVNTEDFSEMGCTWNGTLLSKQGQINTEIWMIGSNTHGQLGSGTQIDKQPCKVSLGLDEPFSVVDVACGSEHIILVIEVMTGGRRVMTWGWNEHGNLGLGQDDKTDRWEPKKVDQSVLEGGRVLNAWAGCGTSWLLVEYND